MCILQSQSRTQWELISLFEILMWFIFLVSLCPREVETQIIQLEALEAPTCLGALVVAREMLAAGPQRLEIPPVVVVLTHLESEDVALKIKN